MISTTTAPTSAQRREPRAVRSMGTIAEGVLAGLAGAAAVALWFFVADVIAGEPLRTPNLLGAVLFDGAQSAADVVPRAGLVTKFTVLHAAAFVVFATLIAGLMALADRDVRVFFIVFALFCCFQVVVAVAITALASWLLTPIPLWSLVGANLLATAAMLAVIWPRHSVTWRRYVDAHDDD